MTSSSLIFQKLWESTLGGLGRGSAWHYGIVNISMVMCYAQLRHLNSLVMNWDTLQSYTEKYSVSGRLALVALMLDRLIARNKDATHCGVNYDIVVLLLLLGNKPTPDSPHGVVNVRRSMEYVARHIVKFTCTQ